MRAQGLNGRMPAVGSAASYRDAWRDGVTRHDCPRCGRSIRWQLLYCMVCRTLVDPLRRAMRFA